MSRTPPRRSRRRPPRDEGPSLPLVPILIAVIVIGFVIGAGLSMAARHRDEIPGAGAASAPPTIPPLREAPPPSPEPATPQPSDSPSASPSPRPSPKRTHAPPSPSPLPSAGPSASPSAEVSPSPAASQSAPAASPAATPAGTAAPTASAAPTATPAPQPARTRKPATEAPATAVPATAPPATAAPQTASPATSASQGDGAATPFGHLAASVVRVYLTAVGRGDRDAAVAELAAPPSGRLPEAGIVDASTEIRHVEVHGGGSIVTVDVDLHTASGSYAAQYTVKRTDTGAALIVDGSIVKS